MRQVALLQQRDVKVFKRRRKKLAHLKVFDREERIGVDQVNRTVLVTRVIACRDVTQRAE